MTKTMMFYNNITPISRETHKNLKFKETTDYGFAKNTHFVPIAATEFGPCSRHYPTLFMTNKEDKNNKSFIPIALFSLEENLNLFVDENNQWKKGTYIPAFIRRYPFMLAGSNDAKELSVCADLNSTMFSEKDGVELFNADESVSPFFQERIQFLNSYKIEMERSQEFINMLLAADLIHENLVEIKNNNGLTVQLKDFWMANDDKFAKLSGSQLGRFHKKGYLSWLFNHAFSLTNLPLILDMQIEHQLKQAQTEKPATIN